VESRVHELQRQIKKQRVIIALLGAGGRGLAERRTVASELRGLGFNTIIPEDALPLEVSPSIAEPELLAWPELDLAFLNIESWGSASEFAQFQSDSRIANKLRVIVPRRHHPLYGSGVSSGYLTDMYLTHDAVFGHVYMHDDGSAADGSLPSAKEIIITISQRFRQWKAINSSEFDLFNILICQLLQHQLQYVIV